MAPLTSSFIADVEEAILAEVTRLCGTGVDAYAEPDYLQLQTVRRGLATIPDFDVADTGLPAFVMEYQLYETKDQHMQASSVTHRWLCTAKAKLSPSKCGYAQTPAEAAFRQCVIASGDTLLRRLEETLAVFSPGIQKTGLPETSGGRFIPWGQIYVDWTGELACDVYAVLEYNLVAQRRRVTT